MSKGGSDSYSLDDLGRPKRISSLFSDQIPPCEVKRHTNGSLICLVCPQMPVSANYTMLTIHRRGKMHQSNLARFGLKPKPEVPVGPQPIYKRKSVELGVAMEIKKSPAKRKADRSKQAALSEERDNKRAKTLPDSQLICKPDQLDLKDVSKILQDVYSKGWRWWRMNIPTARLSLTILLIAGTKRASFLRTTGERLVVTGKISRLKT
eukprot:TRINITY_DN5161_c0_g1_i1.p1 TRINITY_DN5161_c0_g1~~TRINITY_DN5161_c0_g1_i1.p1  ORF type:complete len:208 (+),score=29.46 TRINITY_DN5161_c0_g1_i1:8-631(+)